jgi:hypothetical protein
LILFSVLIYLLIRILGDLTPKLIIRCTSCGKVCDADEAGIIRVTVLPLFSNTFDWCPGCGDVLVHKVEKRS